MKTVYLHIGPHKTGTTTIQQVLFDLQDVLERDHSVRFCQTGRVEGWVWQNINLAWQFLNPRFFKLEQGTWQDLREEIETSSAQTYVVSEELLSHCNQRDVEEIGQALDGFDVRVIFYGRPTVSWLESFYGQRFKDLLHPQLQDFSTFLQTPEAPYRDVGQILPVLDRWAAVFGPENIHLRSMTEARTAPGGLVGDFLSLLRVELTEQPAPGKQANTRMGIRTLRLFTQVAQLIKTARVFLERYEVDEIRNLLGSFGTQQGWNDQIASFSTAECLDIIATRYLPPVQTAFEKYAPDQLFDTTLPEPKTDETDITDSDLAAALAFLKDRVQDDILTRKLNKLISSAKLVSEVKQKQEELLFPHGKHYAETGSHGWESAVYGANDMIKATLEDGSVRYYSTLSIQEISHNPEGVLVAQVKQADGEVARIRLQSFCLLEAGESCV